MLKKFVKLYTYNYSILHGWQELPEYLPSDLDIVIAPEDLPKLEAELVNCSDAQIVNLLQHESTCYYFVLVFWEDGKPKFLPIDAATDYRRDGRVWFSSEALLEKRQRWRDFWVASPEVEFKYLLVKKILKGSVPERSARRLWELVEELGDKVGTFCRELLGERLGEKTFRWIREGNWGEFEAHISQLQKALKRECLRKDLLNPLRYWLPEIRRIFRRWLYPTGLFVAILGSDGSGKSTLIKNLERDLAGAFRRTACFHLMPGLLRRKDNYGPVTDPHAKPPRSFLGSILKLVYYLLDYNLGYWLKIRPMLVRSTLVLFDRYYDDLLVDPKRYRYGGPMKLARWLRHFIPRPELWLILDVPEEELLRRKQEVPPEELRRQREAYQLLSAELPNVVLLDGSLPPEKVARQAEEAILDYLHARYLSRRSLWFSFASAEEEREYLRRALGALISNSGRNFLRLSLPDGRSYLLSLDSRWASVRGLSLYAPQKPKAKILKKVLGLGLRFGVARYLLPKIHLDMREMEEFLAEIFGRKDLSLAVSLGTPGPHRKPVVQVMTKDGKVLGYVKVGWSKISQKLVENEFLMLEKLHNGQFSQIVSPEVLWFGEWNNNLVLLTKPLIKGRGHKTFSIKKLVHILSSHILPEIIQKEYKRELFIHSPFWIEIKARLEKLKFVLSDYQRGLVEDAILEIDKQIGALEIPFFMCLGDITPWNAYMDRMNRLCVVDLENGKDCWLPGWDLFHLIRLYTRLYDRTRCEVIKKSVEHFMSFIGLDKGLTKTLYLAYLLDLYTNWKVVWVEYEKPLSFLAMQSFRILEKEIFIWTKTIKWRGLR